MTQPREWLRADPFRIIWLISVVTGTAFGLVMMDSPDFIDGALVLAGVTRYPAQSVMAVYYLNMWTALHQALAVPLLMGLPSEWLVQIVYVLLGICACAGVLMISVTLTRNLAIAFVASAIVLLYGAPVRFADYGFLFWIANYGTWSAVMCYLAFGLLGSRRMFAAGCVALLAIAVHPVVGLWTAVIICIAVAFASRADPDAARTYWRGAALGAALVALSALIYWLMRAPPMFSEDPELLGIYMKYWDAHRNTPYSPHPMVYAACALCVLASYFGGASRPVALGERALLFAVGIAIISSTGLYEIAHRFREFLPEIVIRAMPTRFPALYVTLLLPLVAGAALRRGWSVLAVPSAAGIVALWSAPAGLLATALACMLLVSPNPRFEGWGIPSRLSMRIAAGIATTFIGALFLAILMHMQLGPRWRALGEAAGRPALWLAITGHLSGSWIDILHPAPPEPMPFPLVDKRSRSLLAQAHRQGLIAATDSLTSDVHRHLHQPVLLETLSFDFPPYLPELSRPIAQIVEEVYGVNYRSPPEAIRYGGSLGELAGKNHWPRLSEADWVRLGRKYCIGGVIAPALWPLQLAMTLDLGVARYYRIPTELPSECKTERG